MQRSRGQDEQQDPGLVAGPARRAEGGRTDGGRRPAAQRARSTGAGGTGGATPRARLAAATAGEPVAPPGRQARPRPADRPGTSGPGGPAAGGGGPGPGHGHGGATAGDPPEDGGALPPPVLAPEEGLVPVRALGARTWLVRETRTGEPFVLRRCAGADGAAAARAAAVQLARRELPGLVRLHALAGPAGRPAGLVEEHVAGGSLEQRVRADGPLDPGAAAALLRGAAAGLAALHGLGWRHGRLTPARVLLRGPGAEGAVLSGAGLPPGAEGPDPAEDVLALGALVWWAMTGRWPRPGTGRPPLGLLCPGSGPELAAAVEAALAEDPARRPTAAELVARTAAPTGSGGAEGPAPGGRAARVTGAPPVPGAAPVDGPEPAAGTSPADATAPVPGPGDRDGASAASGRRRAGGDAGSRPTLRRPAAERPGSRARRPTAGRDGNRPVPARAATHLLAPAAALLTGWLLFGALVPAPPGNSGPAAEPVPAAGPLRLMGGAGAAGPPAAPAPAAEATGDPAEALAELVRLRGRALRTGDAALLERVHAAGSTALAADRRLVGELARRGTDPFAALELTAERIRPLPGTRGPGTAAFRARVRAEGWRAPRDPGPAVVPAGDGWAQDVEARLVDDGAGWRLAEVAPVHPADRDDAGPRR
ncbi:hypothetical protein AUQ48_13105 [Kocuria flava]|uniref:Protein kinase domain-containing protein n=1 Tax=Kocuria flava TaxID=446860 RepID=A0A2N4T455_9MICC|nr:hypothetical protein [Kocuria flava]PLC12986.1 hypothetical protein AUQ48_13105 [Kocuria flava]